MTVRNCQDKEVVFSQEDTADAVFYIHSGTVKLTAISIRRKKAIIAFLQRGSFFGEGCLAGQSSSDVHGEFDRDVQYHSTAEGDRRANA
jgi:CRP-like cAMP-binding protein